MFVIVYKSSVILGPLKWNSLRFQRTIEEDLEMSVTLPNRNDNNEAVIINNDLKILPVIKTKDPEYNSKIQFLHGPFWSFTDTEATSSYIVQDKTIDAVKSQLKGEVATIRYAKEINGTKITIGSTEVVVKTDRDTRSLFVQKFSSMNDIDSVNWKFGNVWLNLTKSDLQNIINSINIHVQTQFDWEMTKTQEIDNCTTLEQLDSVTIERLQDNTRP